MDYQSKYLKYKNKYLNLQKKLYGGTLEDCAQKRFEFYANEITELIINRKNAQRELSLEQVNNNDTTKFKIFNELDEKLIFLNNTTSLNDYDNNFYEYEEYRRDNDTSSGRYALMNYGTNDKDEEKRKFIPYVQNFCYGPTRGIIEKIGDRFIYNWEDIAPGNIVRIWGTLDKSGKIGHVILEITTSNNMNISFGVGFYGTLDEEKIEKMARSEVTIIKLLNSVIHRKNACIYSPDYILHIKLHDQYNYPSRTYVKLLSHGVLTKEEHKNLIDLFSQIQPKKHLARITLNESEYNYSLRYKLTPEDYDILKDEALESIYLDPTLLDVFAKDKTLMKDFERYKKIKHKDESLTKIIDATNKRDVIISKNYDDFFTGFFEEPKTRDLGDITASFTEDRKLFTYNLSYYWQLPDVDYCTLTGFLPEMYSKYHGLKSVVNCTKFVADLFPRIINCTRLESGIIDPQKCEPKNINKNCDKEDVPNDYLDYIKN